MYDSSVGFGFLFDLENRDVECRWEATLASMVQKSRYCLAIKKFPPLVTKPGCSSLEFSSIIELKQLMHTLKYAFLSNNKSFPKIISSVLLSMEEERLIGILKRDKKAIGWKVGDRQGTDHFFCIHCIHTLKGCKWLDVGISNNEWVSPVSSSWKGSTHCD